MMRFLNFFTQQTCRPSSSRAQAHLSNLSNFINPKCLPHYRKTMEEHKLAQKFMDEGDFIKADVHIDAAIKESAFISGVTPFIASFRGDLFELKDKIEAEKKTVTRQ